MSEGRRFVVVAILLAAAIVVVANVVAAQLDAPINWITSTVSAVVVGGFLSALLFGRRGASADGFDIDAVRQRKH